MFYYMCKHVHKTRSTHPMNMLIEAFRNIYPISRKCNLHLQADYGQITWLYRTDTCFLGFFDRTMSSADLGQEGLTSARWSHKQTTSGLEKITTMQGWKPILELVKSRCKNRHIPISISYIKQIHTHTHPKTKYHRYHSHSQYSSRLLSNALSFFLQCRHPKIGLIKEGCSITAWGVGGPENIREYHQNDISCQVSRY